MKKSIAFRLTLAVFITGMVSLLGLGYIINSRLSKGLEEQSIALSILSENMLQERLKGDIALVGNKIDEFSQTLENQVRDFSRRPDVIKAINSGNDVTINEKLKALNKDESYDVLIAFNERGLVLGASKLLNQIDVTEKIKTSEFNFKLLRVTHDNSRAHPLSYFEKGSISVPILESLGLKGQDNLSYTAIFPVFDDFGETVGAIMAIRFLKSEEEFLNRFAELANVNVLIAAGDKIMTRTDNGKIKGLSLQVSAGLLKTPDDKFIAHCTYYKEIYSLCLVSDAFVLNEMRGQMLSIGQEQMQKLRRILMLAGTWTMIILTFILFIIINGTMRGLSTLTKAAQDVAAGNLETPFKPLGVGEINTLSLSFEKMLQHLRAHTQKIHQLAFYDDVTGLANRTKFSEEVAKHLESTSKKIILMVDIANFKGINDTYGLKTGDKLLVKTAERLTQVLKFYSEQGTIANVMLSRLNGSNFAILFTSLANDVALQTLCTIVTSHLGKPIQIGSSHLITSNNIGIVSFSQTQESFDILIGHAQLALDEARKKGRNAVSFFAPAMQSEASKRQNIEIELKSAIAQKVLQVFYQPKISCEDGKVSGSEALVRWHHPQMGFISPGIFIPIAEEAGLIGEIGRFVLEKAIQDTKMLLMRGHQLCTSVNVSALQLEDPRFADDVLELLRRFELPPIYLELEITESMAMRDLKGATERITRLREAGIKFSMDDFGTGYSNLSQLAKMPIDVLKLDRSLIQDVHLDKNKQVLAHTILLLAKELGFKTVVEGVEKYEELAFCLHHSASSVQGFIFSGAVPMEKFLPFLEPADLKLSFGDVFEKMGGPRLAWQFPPIKRTA